MTASAAGLKSLGQIENIGAIMKKIYTLTFLLLGAGGVLFTQTAPLYAKQQKAASVNKSKSQSVSEQNNFSAPAATAVTPDNDSRVALVIGNSAYKNAPLDNPVNDANDMTAKLRSLGFNVIERKNLNMRQIGSTLREFRSKLTPGATALVFYAGHGIQIKGENYLPAVDAEINSEEDVANQSIAVRQIMDVLDESKTRLNLVFLDACRNNPYSRSFRSGSTGLARVSAPSGTLISYATRPGSVAADGEGRNGLYTSQLLEHMDSNQPIELTLKEVVRDVKSRSLGKQEPWMEGSIEGNFCFKVCVPATVQQVPAADPASIELSFWNSIKDSRNPADFQAYLDKYPNGQFEALARNRLNATTPEPVKNQATFSKESRQSFEPEMVAIREGCFLMGSPATEKDRKTDEVQHKVCVSRFEIGKYEITKGQFSAFVAEKNYQTDAELTGGCYFYNGKDWVKNASYSWRNVGFVQGDNHPASCISLNDAQAYVAWLNEKTGKAYHLPTEAQWEYTARAGTTTAFYTGNCINPNQASYNGNFDYSNCGTGAHRDQSVPVGSYPANPWGVYDMAGSVWEWTCSDYDPNYYGSEKICSSSGAQTNRTLRGGSWFIDPKFLRSANRDRYTPDYAIYDRGFRLARF